MKKGILTQTLQFNNPNGRFPEKKERNEELYKDFKNGVELFDLSYKYRLTTTRIYKIIQQMEKKEAKRA